MHLSKQSYIILAIAGLAILIGGCFPFSHETHSAVRLTRNIYLTWFGEPRSQNLLQSNDKGKSGALIIEETVYAVGYNDSFLIAKQHPNKEKEVSDRLFRNSDANGYLLQNPADSVYLSGDDSVYRVNGKIYHWSNGWNPPDSLYPYKKQTFFYILDLRSLPANRTLGDKNIYKFDSEQTFKEKRRALGVPDTLSFFYTNSNLE